jgi:NAD(P)-dependent dehydrogenase (short-subunit alcohol dehydrogenase family)
MSLSGKVAVVTGSSRGIGRGIAAELGAAGATVYLTGRADPADPTAPSATLRESAQRVTDAGGTGIPVACDHADDSQTEALFARVDTDHGQLDILVNCAATLPSTPEDFAGAALPFWENGPETWDLFADVGMRSHYVASLFAARIMTRRPGGLIVNICSAGAAGYFFCVAYGVNKAALDRFTADAAHELRDRGTSVVSLWPSAVKTETTRELEAGGLVNLAEGESPELTGRAVVALAADPDVTKRSGKAFFVAALAHEYGFTETDGSMPDLPDYSSLLHT